jgi:hypothetical protein
MNSKVIIALPETRVYVFKPNIIHPRGRRVFVPPPQGAPSDGRWGSGIIGGSFDLRYPNGKTVRVGLTVRHLFEWQDTDKLVEREFLGTASSDDFRPNPNPQGGEQDGSDLAAVRFGKSLCRTPYSRPFYSVYSYLTSS